MADHVDDRYYAVVDEKPKGLSKDEFDQAKEKLAAAAEGRDYEPKQQADVVDEASHPAATEPTIAETQKVDKPKAPAKK